MPTLPERPTGSVARTHRALASAALLLLGFPTALPARAAFPGVTSTPLVVPSASQPRLSLLPPDLTSITFSNRLSPDTISTNRLLEIGSGVALGDVDGDGRPDIYFCGLDLGNRLYANLGNWRFADITARAGVACPGNFSTGAVLVDLDGDRDLDLLVNGLGAGTRLFRNDGTGGFSEDLHSGLVRRFGATSMALADLDGDGDLDLYVTNYRSDTFHDHPAGLRVEMRLLPDGTRVLEPRDRFLTLPTRQGVPTVIERGEADLLYLNQGRGRFVSVPWNLGLFLDAGGHPVPGPPTDWGLAVLFRDLNGDRLPDLYVCNDFVAWPDRIWWNEEGSRFRAAPPIAFRATSLASMAVDAADINRDGIDDLFVADMLHPRRRNRAWQRPDTLAGAVDWPRQDPAFRPEVPRNTLQLGRGKGTFAEIAALTGLAATDWTTGAAFLDVDLDGWEDLLVVTGNLHDVQDADALVALGNEGRVNGPNDRRSERSRLPPRPGRSTVFRNRHDLTFEDLGATWGFEATGVAHGLAFADLDGDGDQDIVVNAMNAPARVYRNESSSPRIQIRLRGAAENTRGAGARLILRGGPVEQSQEIMAGGRYASSDDPTRTFATGSARELALEILWRSGKRTLVPGLLPNHLHEIDETLANDTPPSPNPTVQPRFEDATGRIRHLHANPPSDDLRRQPLLPRQLHTRGPGLSWAKLAPPGETNALPSLVIPGPTGIALLRPARRGSFQFPSLLAAAEPGSVAERTTALLVRREGTASFLVTAETRSVDHDPSAPTLRLQTLGAPTNHPGTLVTLPGTPSAPGPLSLADVDGDGTLDLFVGGQFVPHRYPEPADSHLLLGTSNSFRVARHFPRLGLVSGSVFTDWDGDGDPDLALACEWGPIRLFRNEGGRFEEVTPSFGLAGLSGRWNGIAAGDFDGDGQLDLVASNWGRNWRTDTYPAAVPTPVQLAYGEFAGDGTLHPILASPEPSLSTVTPWMDRDALANSIPAILARAPTYHLFGETPLPRLLGLAQTELASLEATFFDSVVLLNRGTRFEVRSLPVEAQFTPAFGLAVADFDGDGNEDVFLAQNSFGNGTGMDRQDAGLGLLLLGDGTGHFRAIPPGQSGIEIPGEQRGCAVADFDGDGRPDLAVGQSGGATRLFRNRAARPGLRVQLLGPTGNPDAIGAVLRLRFDRGLGPVRELHAGSGYDSQDDPHTILATPTPPSALVVRWPGGGQTEHPLSAGQDSVVARRTGPNAP